jgi:hypothetical protein
VTGGTGDRDLVRACPCKLHGPIGCPAPDRSHIATEESRIEEATPDVPDYAYKRPKAAQTVERAFSLNLQKNPK